MNKKPVWVEDNDDEDVPLILTLLGIAMLPLVMLVFGAVYSQLWQWFAVAPLGAPAISKADACGLGVLVSLLFVTMGRSPSFAKSPLFVQNLVLILVYLVCFGAGYLVHLCQ